MVEKRDYQFYIQQLEYVENPVKILDNISAQGVQTGPEQIFVTTVLS